MYLVKGEYHDYEVFYEVIFGYNENNDACVNYIKQLKTYQADYSERKAKIYALGWKNVPSQEKFEKLKDYDKRIKPILEHNNHRRDEEDNLRRELEERYPFLADETYYFTLLTFKVYEVNRIEV